jgi:hypothetical protein
MVKLTETASSVVRFVLSTKEFIAYLPTAPLKSDGIGLGKFLTLISKALVCTFTCFILLLKKKLFERLLPNIFNINVRQGKGNPNGAVSTKPIVENKDIRYIKTATSFSNKSTPFPNTNVYYGLLFFPFLVLGGAFAYKQILLRNDSIDLIALKKKKAQKVAIKRLASAEQFLKANDSRNFYDEISRTLLGYICDKLSIPLSELTKDNVNQRLQDLKVKDQHITDFMSIIKITERALFAGMNNSGDMQATYEKSVKIISEIEEELN